MKMVWETQKIMEDESILVNPTAVQSLLFMGILKQYMWS